MLANRRHSITKPPERKNWVSGPEKLHSGDGRGQFGVPFQTAGSGPRNYRGAVRGADHCFLSGRVH